MVAAEHRRSRLTGDMPASGRRGVQKDRVLRRPMSFSGRTAVLLFTGTAFRRYPSPIARSVLPNRRACGRAASLRRLASMSERTVCGPDNCSARGAGRAKDAARQEEENPQYERTRMQTVTVAGRRLKGISIGASETCIISPEHLAFDIGRCPQAAVRMRTIAFTHLHVDHIAGLPFHLATRNLQRMAPPVYIVPRQVAPAVEEIIQAFSKLDGTTYAYEVVPLSPGETYQLKRGWLLKAFETMHTVPSQGYILYEIRNKLLSEFVGFPPAKLAALRRSGSRISVQNLAPELAVTGDTTLDALAACPEARRARALVTELTFLDDSSTIESARGFGHVHIDEVVGRARELFSECGGVLFTHFSGRYSVRDIQTNVSEKLPEHLLAKTTLLLGERISVVPDE